MRRRWTRRPDRERKTESCWWVGKMGCKEHRKKCSSSQEVRSASLLMLPSVLLTKVFTSSYRNHLAIMFREINCSEQDFPSPATRLMNGSNTEPLKAANRIVVVAFRPSALILKASTVSTIFIAAASSAIEGFFSPSITFSSCRNNRRWRVK